MKSIVMYVARHLFGQQPEIVKVECCPRCKGMVERPGETIHTTWELAFAALESSLKSKVEDARSEYEYYAQALADYDKNMVRLQQLKQLRTTCAGMKERREKDVRMDQ